MSARTQSSLAISGDDGEWLLLNASPDLRQQLVATPALHPRQGDRDSPIGAVFLTNGDVDHIAGLLSLRERQRFSLFGTAALLDLLESDPVFAVLDPGFVTRTPVPVGQRCNPIPGLTVEMFSVPGKVPLYLETDTVEIGRETEMTIGLELTSDAGRVVYVPGCASITPELLARLSGADVLLFDGTTYTDDEMVQLGLSHKTAARMGHIAISGPKGSLQALAAAKVGRRIFTHINNTNPILVAGSPERAAVERAGWDVAYDGMEIVL